MTQIVEVVVSPTGETKIETKGFAGSSCRDGSRFLSGNSDHTLNLWDARTGKLLKAFKAHDDKVNSVAFSADGTELLSGSEDRTVNCGKPLPANSCARSQGIPSR